MQSGKKKSDVKFVQAHVTGPSDVVFHPNGEHFFTHGSDNVKIWSKPGELQHTVNKHDESVTAVAVSRAGDRFASCSEDRFVKLYFYNGEVTEDKFAGRFGLPVRCVAWHNKGAFVAAGGDEGVIKQFLAMDPSQVQSLKGHDGTVRHLQYDPKDQYLASSGCDGTLRIWAPMEAEKLVATIEHLIPAHKPDDPQLARFAWHPSGQFIAVPGNTDVKVIERDTWKVAYTLKGAHNKPISTVSWSPDGAYLASAGLDNQCFIWNIKDKEEVEKFKHTEQIVSFAWSPKQNALVMIDAAAHFAVWNHPIPDRYTPSAAETNPLAHLMDDVTFADDDDADLLEAVADAEKTASGGEQTERANGDAKPSTPAAAAAPEPFDDLDRVDPQPAAAADDKIKSLAKEQASLLAQSTAAAAAKRRRPLGPRAAAGAAQAVVPVATGPAPQPPFQPGSDTSGKPKRVKFLAYTNIGQVTIKDETGAVEIEFHDRTRKPVKFSDFTNAIAMGALGEKGAVFASRQKGDMASSIMFHSIDSWAGNNSNWSVLLPPDEEATAVTLCDEYVAVSTSRGFLRIFTHTGVQVHVVSLSNVVCMAGYSHFLAIAYHSSPPINGNQNMAYLVFDMRSQRRALEGALPLTSGSLLKWFGFSSSGYLCTVDTDGVVRMLGGAFGLWTPIKDFRFTAKDRKWVFAVLVDKIKFLKLHEEETDPATYPPPMPNLADFDVPILQKDVTGTELEEKYVREKFMLDSMRQPMHVRNGSKVQQEQIESKAVKQLDGYLLRLFETAMTGDKHLRAENLCSLMNIEAVLRFALKKAHEANKLPLAERLAALAKSKFDAEESDAENESADEDDAAADADDSPRPPSKKPSILIPPGSATVPAAGSPTAGVSPRATLNRAASNGSVGSSKLAASGSSLSSDDSGLHSSTGDDSRSSLSTSSSSTVSKRPFSLLSASTSKLLEANGKSAHDADANAGATVEAPRKKNKFVQEKPVRSGSTGNLFESLASMQKQATDSKKRKP